MKRVAIELRREKNIYYTQEAINLLKAFKGLRVVRFEDILQKFGCHTIMNVHIKPFGGKLYDEKIMKKIVGLIRKYDCAKHVYLMIQPDEDIRMFKKYAPDIPICVGHDFNRPWSIVDRAIALGAEKVQFFKLYFNQEMVDKAHANGIIYNVFWSHDPEERTREKNRYKNNMLRHRYYKISVSFFKLKIYIDFT